MNLMRSIEDTTRYAKRCGSSPPVESDPFDLRRDVVLNTRMIVAFLTSGWSLKTIEMIVDVYRFLFSTVTTTMYL